jgi:FKBP-type peptidyl-prolyl cis-trans isomerase 2
MITQGSTVEVHYTGRFPNEEQSFDSSEGRDPLKFEVGVGQVIPGFENAILGKNVGDKVQVTISATEAYGEVREDLFVQVPLDKLPGEVEVGQELQADSGNGQPVRVVVEAVNEDHVVINGNHPLAGKDLVFDIEVVSVQKTETETETETQA